MNTHKTSRSSKRVNPVSGIPIAQLVGNIYDEVPIIGRKRMLAHRLHSLGILSVFGVANGIFAKILFRGGLRDGYGQLEDIREVCTSEVIALVEGVHQLGIDSLDGLRQMMAVSPLMACSNAAALLVMMLVQRVRSRVARTSGTVAFPVTQTRTMSATQDITRVIRTPDA